MGVIAFLYGVIAYGAFLVSFTYAVGFIGDFIVPKTMNSGLPGPLGPSLAIDLALLGLFGVQHSVMARPGFKRWWTQIVPRTVERSTYVLLSSLVLLLLYWQWRPIEGIVWRVEGPAAVVLWVVCATGWLIALITTFLISHFDLFGLRQVYLRLIGRPYTNVEFKTVAFYKYVRHPLMFGFLVAFWATPNMTVNHLLFAAATTAYIFIALFFEERDLAAAHGASYERYRAEVPMILPRLSVRASEYNESKNGVMR
jgi:protein-S-isoprenylcysteine O-methyltransferase Ste14